MPAADPELGRIGERQLMQDGNWLLWLSIIITVVSFLAIGVYFHRKSRTTEGYFLADRDLPGWLVGVSLMATIVSSITFLAIPGFSYQENWRYMPWSLGFLLAVFVWLFLFMPFFRRSGVQSAYEYLERRYGLWARLYAAFIFVVWLVCRSSIVLYASALPVRTLVDVDLVWIILATGLVVTLYTVIGGIRAVIWTDFLQSIAMFLGASVCLPVIAYRLPGGLGRILSEAHEQGKMSMGSTGLGFDDKTIWVILLLSLFTWMHWGCQDQTVIQRYCAPRTDREARKALWWGALLTIPIWTYFIFLGTALFVFYRAFPDPRMASSVEKAEQILPFFVITQLPKGLAGLFICGLISAAMSTLSGGLNAVAQTITNDFYRRLSRKQGTEVHYLRVARRITLGLGLLIIGGGMLIHFSNTLLLQDLQVLIQSIAGGGLLAITLLAMLAARVGNREAKIAIGAGLGFTVIWLLLASKTGSAWLPGLSSRLPDSFWIHVIVNVIVLVLGLLLSLRSRRKPDNPGTVK